MTAIVNSLGLDIVTALFVGLVFGLVLGVVFTITFMLFPREIVVVIKSPYRLLRWSLSWRRNRKERRRSLDRARHNALLMACGGTVIMPRKRFF